jgi:hypothetical protein
LKTNHLASLGWIAHEQIEMKRERRKIRLGLLKKSARKSLCIHKSIAHIYLPLIYFYFFWPTILVATPGILVHFT